MNCFEIFLDHESERFDASFSNPEGFRIFQDLEPSSITEENGTVIVEFDPVYGDEKAFDAVQVTHIFKRMVRSMESVDLICFRKKWKAFISDHEVWVDPSGKSAMVNWATKKVVFIVTEAK